MYIDKDNAGYIGIYALTKEQAEIVQIAMLALAESRSDCAEVNNFARRVAIDIDRCLPNPVIVYKTPNPTSIAADQSATIAKSYTKTK